jgi:multidrug efflux pump subunit AcrA (membrane-fusion protein)
MRLTKLTLANLSLLAVAATGGGLAYASLGPPAAATTAAVARTASIGTGTVMTTVSSSGNVTAPGNITINFATSGKLTELGVRVGQQVKQGQPLARVDSTAAKASLDSAKAQLAAAQAKFVELQDRTTSLVKQGLQISADQASSKS